MIPIGFPVLDLGLRQWREVRLLNRGVRKWAIEYSSHIHVYDVDYW